MSTVRNVLDALESIAPARFAFEFDKVGLQVGHADAALSRAVVSLDRSLAAVEYAEQAGAQLLLSHHPLIFQPLSTVNGSSHVGRTILRLARSNIAFIAAHTNWDSAQGGVNDALADRLALQDLQPFGGAAEVRQWKLVLFAPKDSVDQVISAVSDAGAGEIGLYRRCAFISEGTGTFIGGEGARPVVGEPGKIESVDEARVEMVVRSGDLDRVAAALRASHPYEEPAFDFVPLNPIREQPAGRIGVLAEPTSLRGLVEVADRALSTRSQAWGDGSRRVERVAVVGGAADGDWRAAQESGADVLVTGEVRQHNALEATESGFALIAAGHYGTEQPGVEALTRRMREGVPEVEWMVFEPKPGYAGRPLA